MVLNRWVWGSVSCLAVIGAVVQPYRPMVVMGTSMTPTYRDGEALWTAPVDRPLRRGDVVVADGPDGPVIKRVALLPGDRRAQWRTVEGWDDIMIVKIPKNLRGRAAMRLSVVPPGTVFLLGDHLMTSVDSRSFGPVPLASVRRLVLDAREPAWNAQVALEGPRKWISDAIRAGAPRWVMRRGERSGAGKPLPVPFAPQSYRFHL